MFRVKDNHSKSAIQSMLLSLLRRVIKFLFNTFTFFLNFMLWYKYATLNIISALVIQNRLLSIAITRVYESRLSIDKDMWYRRFEKAFTVEHSALRWELCFRDCEVSLFPLDIVLQPKKNLDLAIVHFNSM